MPTSVSRECECEVYMMVLTHFVTVVGDVRLWRIWESVPKIPRENSSPNLSLFYFYFNRLSLRPLSGNALNTSKGMAGRGGGVCVCAHTDTMP